MINYDHEDGVSVSSKLTSSVLTVRNATARHGGKKQGNLVESVNISITETTPIFRLGNYTCAPANARQSSIYVHVLKGK